MPVSPQTALTETIKVLITAILTDCITLSRTSGTVIVVRMDIITQDLLIMGDVQAITGNALIAQMIGMCCSHMGLVCCQSILGRHGMGHDSLPFVSAFAFILHVSPASRTCPASGQTEANIILCQCLQTPELDIQMK